MTICTVARVPCPKCGRILDRAGTLGGTVDPDAPRIGDFTICSYCLSLLRFADDGAYTYVSPSEIAALDPELRDALTGAVEFAIGLMSVRPVGRRDN